MGSTLFSFTIQETLLKKKLSLGLSRVNIGPMWGRCTITEYLFAIIKLKRVIKLISCVFKRNVSVFFFFLQACISRVFQLILVKLLFFFCFYNSR